MPNELKTEFSETNYKNLLNGILFLILGIVCLIVSFWITIIFMTIYIFAIAIPIIIGTYQIVLYFKNRKVIFGSNNDETAYKQVIISQKFKNKENYKLLGLVVGILIITAIIMDLFTFIRLFSFE